MLKRYRDGIVPAKSNELATEVAMIAKATCTFLEQNQLQAALQNIWYLVERSNRYVEQTKPFNLAKDPAQSKRLDEVLYNLAEVCRVLAVLLWPFLPGTATKIYSQLGLSSVPDKFSEAVWGKLEPGHKIGEPAPLFPRKDN
jgi:methionyl-tRNA synthetase